MPVSLLNSILQFAANCVDVLLSKFVWILPNNSVIENLFSVDVNAIDRGLTSVAGSLAGFNQIFPFDTLFFIISLWLFAELGIMILGLFVALFTKLLPLLNVWKWF